MIKQNENAALEVGATLKVYADGGYIEDADKIGEAVLKELGQKERFYVDLTFLSEEEMRELNNRERGVDAVTDVLSFPMLDGVRSVLIKKEDFPFDYDEDENAIFLGSVAICRQRAIDQAAEYGHSEKRELAYLLTHSLLHLFGYDHMTDEDKAEMREKEENVMKELGISR